MTPLPPSPFLSVQQFGLDAVSAELFGSNLDIPAPEPEFDGDDIEPILRELFKAA